MNGLAFRMRSNPTRRLLLSPTNAALSFWTPVVDAACQPWRAERLIPGLPRRSDGRHHRICSQLPPGRRHATMKSIVCRAPVVSIGIIGQMLPCSNEIPGKARAVVHDWPDVAAVDGLMAPRRRGRGVRPVVSGNGREPSPEHRYHGVLRSASRP